MKIVVKVGSNLLLNKRGIGIDVDYIRDLCNQISTLTDNGNEVILVSSGAYVSGYGLLKVKYPQDISKKQALCAIGQVELMKAYSTAFGERKKYVSQLLVTRDDFDNRKRFLNIRNTLISLAEFGVIPIINENDTVATDEIRVGDNDTLASYVAIGTMADILILLTSVNGVFAEDGSLISVYDEHLPLLAMENSHWGQGGVKTKIAAAKRVSNVGITAVVANGRIPNAVLRIAHGEKIGTIFPKSTTVRAKKAWIGFVAKPSGKIFVDKGARTAILQGKSLLPIGVIRVEGNFFQGDTVEITFKDTVIAHGITNYSSDELSKIRGVYTSDIEKILGHSGYEEVCHADNLIIKCEAKGGF